MHDREFSAKYYIDKFFYFALLSALTLPLALVKQALVYRAGMDVPPTVENVILDMLNLRSGWLNANTFPYNSALWFVDVLLIEYLFYILICTAVNKNNHIYEICCFVAAMLGLFLVKNPAINVFMFNSLVGRGTLNFFTGVLFCELYLYCSSHASVRSYLVIFSVIVLAAILICIVLQRSDLLGDTRIVFTWLLWPCLLYVCLFFQPVYRLFSLKPFIFLGRLSNTIYFWHHPLVYITYSLVTLGIWKIHLSDPFFAIFFMAATVALALIINTFIEKKATQVYHKILK